MEDIGHEHHHHHHDGDGEAPDKRLLALLNYMYSHNADHTRELEELAIKVRDTGNEAAYEQTMKAVSLFKSGNDALKAALDNLDNE